MFCGESLSGFGELLQPRAADRCGCSLGGVGKQLGESTLLYRLLERRCGPLPAWVHEKLATVDGQTLEHWGLVFLEAETLKDVFKA